MIITAKIGHVQHRGGGGVGVERPTYGYKRYSLIAGPHITLLTSYEAFEGFSPLGRLLNATALK